MALTASTKTIEQSEVIAVARIEQHGTALTLPADMTIDQAIKLLERRKVYDGEVVKLTRRYEAFPWDGAVALDEVLKKRYGWSPAMAIPGLFGPKPPELKAVEVAPGVIRQVPWGRFRIPGIDADLFSVVDTNNNRITFALATEVQRKFEGEVTKLYGEVADYLAQNSIYRGQAFRLDFQAMDDNGIVEPRFIDTRSINPAQLIFSRDVENAVETNVFTPIRRIRQLAKHRLPFKRGVLLAGTWGTGKTLAARIAAKHSVDNDITFIDCPQSAYLSSAVEFAKMYQPAVIFCEDIDRSVTGDRTEEMDAILNVVDGVDSKNLRIFIVLTTNDAKAINPAMVRPGRLDSVIDVKPPDAEAVERLLRMYGAGVLAADEDLAEVGQVLDGNIPAVIEEVVKRSKLTALKHAGDDVDILTVTAADLLESAKTMRMQLDLLYHRDPKPEVPLIDQAFRAMVRSQVEEELTTVVSNTGAARSMASNASQHAQRASASSAQTLETIREVRTNINATAEAAGKIHENVKGIAKASNAGKINMNAIPVKE